MKKVLFLVALVALTTQGGQCQTTQPSSQESKFVVGDPARASARTPFNLPQKTKSYSEAADLLNKTLANAGYNELAWYLYETAPHQLSGFALFTKLEQIDPSGKPLQDGNRYSLDNEAPKIGSLVEYVRALLLPAPAGRYRVIAFYVFRYDHPTTQQPMRAPIEKQDAIFVAGARFLPGEIAKEKRPTILNGIAYIYEYEKKNADDAGDFVPTSKQDGKQHLIAAGLGELLKP